MPIKKSLGYIKTTIETVTEKIIKNQNYYIIAEQNEINIKESTKETKIKRIAHLSKFLKIRNHFSYDSKNNPK